MSGVTQGTEAQIAQRGEKERPAKAGLQKAKGEELLVRR
jgi:hypothetical protein